MQGDDVFFVMATTPANADGWVEAACAICGHGDSVAEFVVNRSFRKSKPRHIQRVELGTDSGLVNVMMLRDEEQLSMATIIRGPMWVAWYFAAMTLVSKWKESQND